MTAGTVRAKAERDRFPLGFLIFSIVALAMLVSLGTWQVKRLAWKEGLLATIHERINTAPRPLATLEKQFATTHDVEYWPVTAQGTFLNGTERDFLATWKGASGFFVYAPLRLDDGRFLFVNRGFVPYDHKDPATWPAGEVKGEVTITGLARNPLAEKPSSLVPDNDLAKDIFYWKDIKAMAATAGLPKGAVVLPFFVDANDAPNPGGLPVGGVTHIDLPNNHFQYALTWYGLAAIVAVFLVLKLWRWKRGDENPQGA
jgi:surfeit locus 1 family protein